MPLSGGTTSSSTTSSNGGDSVADVKLYPSAYGNPITIGSKVYLKLGTTLLASVYPNFPFTANYGTDPTATTFWTDFKTALPNGSTYNSTPDFAATDGSSQVFVISGDGQYAGYSTDGGTTFTTTGNTGISATVIYDLQYYAASNLFVAATGNGIYTFSPSGGSVSGTQRLSTGCYSIGINGANLCAVPLTSGASVYISSNATSWAGGSVFPVSQYYTCVRYVNGAWYAVGGSTAQGAGTLYTCTNATGTSFTASSNTNFNASGYCQGVTDIQYVGGRYFTVANLRSGNSTVCSGSSLNSLSLQLAAGGAGSATTPNGGQLVYNGQYLLWATINSFYFQQMTGTGAPTISVNFAYNGTNYYGSGAAVAFTSGPYVGRFRVKANYSNNQHYMFYTLNGLYLNMNGSTAPGAPSGLSYFARIS